jgi:hypothetical protein
MRRIKWFLPVEDRPFDRLGHPRSDSGSLVVQTGRAENPTATHAGQGCERIKQKIACTTIPASPFGRPVPRASRHAAPGVIGTPGGQLRPVAYRRSTAEELPSAVVAADGDV